VIYEIRHPMGLRQPVERRGERAMKKNRREERERENAHFLCSHSLKEKKGERERKEGKKRVSKGMRLLSVRILAKQERERECAFSSRMCSLLERILS